MVSGQQKQIPLLLFFFLGYNKLKCHWNMCMYIYIYIYIYLENIIYFSSFINLKWRLIILLLKIKNFPFLFTHLIK